MQVIGQVVSTARQRARRAHAAGLVAPALFEAHLEAQRALADEAARKRELRAAELQAEKAARAAQRSANVVVVRDEGWTLGDCGLGRNNHGKRRGSARVARQAKRVAVRSVRRQGRVVVRNVVPAEGFAHAEPPPAVEPVALAPMSSEAERAYERAVELAELISEQSMEMAQEQPNGWVDTCGEYREPILDVAGELVDDQAWVVGLLSTDPRVFAPVQDRWSDGWWTEPGALDARREG